ncbi:MAG: ABC transporter substrate-binding protein [Rhizomicrobium sp.]|jgi:iron complex transport system substrate-binding protein
MRLLHGCPAFLLSVVTAISIAQAAPQRVVSTHLCADEYVYRLVPRDRIAALSYLAADTHPVVSTIADKVGGIRLTRASSEEVLTLSPDLVVMYQGTNPRLRAHLEESHIPFIEIPWAETLDDVRRITREVGRELGAPDRADAMISEMDRTLAEARTQAPHPAVATLIYEPNGYATTGAIADAIMADAGLADVAASLGPTRAGTIPVEAVIADAPALLILNGSSKRVRSEADLVLQHPGLTALSGTTQISRLTLTPLLCPGPWSAAIAPELSRQAHDAAARSRTRT